MSPPNAVMTSGRRQPRTRGISAPAPGTGPLAAVLLLQLALLTTGIQRDYRLKHEDNNAFHATFARAHLQLGFATTHGQNYFYNPASGQGRYYANHPPGPGLALAAVYAATGRDGPLVTRATAIAFHLLGTWLFYGLARRVLRHRWEVLLALGIYALIPESAFFGRMLNHEVMALPGVILLVRGYLEGLRGTWTAARWVPAAAAGSLLACMSGWAGFFAIAACALHAACEIGMRGNRRAGRLLLAFAGGGILLFAATIAQLALGAGADMAYLRQLFAERSGVGRDIGMAPRIGRLIELHWRYFGLTSLVALAALAWRIARRLRSAAADDADDAGMIFLMTGAGYVAAFSLNASRHDYWQFLLLPASALAITIAARHLANALTSGRRMLWRAVAVIAVVDLLAASTFTLLLRHRKGERYCIETVAALRRDYL